MIDFTLFNVIKDEILNRGKNVYKWVEEDLPNKGIDFDTEEYLSEKRLNSVIKEYGDAPFARKSKDDYSNENRSTFGHNNMDIDEKIVDLISNEFNSKYISSGRYWYPSNGFLGWHTNSNATGERLYIIWAEDDNKSFFRYKDKDTGKIVTKWEKKGWQINRFKPPIWHCVGSYTNRVSFGFRKGSNNGI